MRSSIRFITSLIVAAIAVALAVAAPSGAGAETMAPKARDVIPNASGAPMPVGDIPGWRQIFVDDFTTPTSTFPGPYAASWTAYGPGANDASGHGFYTPKAITTHDGVMDIHLMSVNGRSQVAAPVPMPAQNGTKTGQIYGRYVVRFKSDNLPGYKTEWNLWPDSNNTAEGKMDFPQGSLSGSINALENSIGPGSHQVYWTSSKQPYTSWHTATIEWLKSGVTYYLDGVKIGYSPISPSTSFHWVLQTETQTGSAAPDPAVDGHVLIDWVAEYAPDASNGGVAATAPGAPRAITAVPGPHSATVSWNTPITNGGAQITHYTATASPGGNSCTTTTLTCTITGLTDGYAYVFSAAAANAVGSGTVSAPTPPATPLSAPTPSEPSGAAMPVGDTGGWHQVMADDFSAASTTFPNSGNWTAYAKGRDTTGLGTYSTSGLSVHNGALDINLRSVNGTPQVAAPVAMQPSGTPFVGSLYGRYVVRFRADSLPGYKTAWLLWPDDNNCQHGEIDFPEGDLDGPIGAYNHQVGNHSAMASAVVTGASYQTWHTADIQWLPSGVSFYLDGNLVASNPNSPSVPMHWVLQTETSTYGKVPAATTAGHVYVDWAAVYSPTAGLLG